MTTFPVKKGEVIEHGEGHSSVAKRDGIAYFDGATLKMLPDERASTASALGDEQIKRGPRLAAQPCAWTLEDDDSGMWSTKCGEAFMFTDGGPKENGTRFCCYCGGKLVAFDDAGTPTAQPVGQTYAKQLTAEENAVLYTAMWDSVEVVAPGRAAVEPSQPAPDPWHDAVLTQCMLVESCYQPAHPVATLATLIAWHVMNERASTPPAPAAPNKPARPAWEIQGAIASGAAPMVGSELNEWRPPTLDTTEAINELIDDFMSLAAFSSDPYGTEEEANAKFNRLDLIREKLVAALAASTKGEAS